VVKKSVWFFTTEENGREDGKNGKRQENAGFVCWMGCGLLHNFFCLSGYRPINKKGVHLITYVTFHYDGYCSCRVGKISFFCFLMDMVMFADFSFPLKII